MCFQKSLRNYVVVGFCVCVKPNTLNFTNTGDIFFSDELIVLLVEQNKLYTAQETEKCLTIKSIIFCSLLNKFSVHAS